MTNKFNFKEDQIEVVKNFLESDFVEFIRDYFSIRINSKQYDNDLENFINGYQFYSDPLMETILQNSCEAISKITKNDVLPTYSLVNMIMKDDIYHSTPNEFNELTSILFLGCSNNEESILNINEKLSLSLSSGDLLIYNHRKIQPYITPLKQKWLLQASLNFVIDEGPYKDNIYHRRPYLGYIN